MAHPTGFEPVTFAFGGQFFGVSHGFAVFLNSLYKQLFKVQIVTFCFDRYCSVSRSVVSRWYPEGLLPRIF